MYITYFAMLISFNCWLNLICSYYYYYTIRAGLINISKEAFKNTQKTRILLKSKLERERNKVEKVLKEIKFNKYDLVFILDKNSNLTSTTSRKISVKVENETNNEMFILDDKEVICKL